MQYRVCEHHFCRRDGLVDSNSAENHRRSDCRLSLDRPPRYSALFLQSTSPSTPPPTYDEALRIVRLTEEVNYDDNATSNQRTRVFIQLPDAQGTVV